MALVAVLLSSRDGFADDSEVEAAFPTVEAVLAKIRGTDELDTAVRQAAMFESLTYAAGDFKVPNQPTKFDTLGHEYFAAFRRCRDRAVPILAKSYPATSGPDTAQMKFFHLYFSFRSPFGEDIKPYWPKLYEVMSKRRAEAMAEADAAIARMKAPKKPNASKHGFLDKIGKDIPEQITLTFAEVQREFGWAPAIGLLLMIIWLVRGIRRELKPFDFHSTDHPMIRAGRTSYRLYTMTGAAVAPRQASRTSVSVSATQDQYGQSVSVSSRTDVYDRFRLVASDGRMEDIQLTNRGVTLLPDDRITMGWAIRKGNQRGPYIFFSNRTMGKTTYFTELIGDMVRPSGWLFFPLWSLVSAVILVPAIRGISAEGITLDGRATLMAGVLMLPLPIVLGIVFLIVRAWIAGRRADRIVDRLNTDFVPNIPVS